MSGGRQVTRRMAAVLVRLADTAPARASLKPYLCHLLDTITEADE